MATQYVSQHYVFPRYHKKNAAAWPNDVSAHVAEKANTWIRICTTFTVFFLLVAFFRGFWLHGKLFTKPFEIPLWAVIKTGLVIIDYAHMVLSQVLLRCFRDHSYVTDLRSRSFRCISLLESANHPLLRSFCPALTSFCRAGTAQFKPKWSLLQKGFEGFSVYWYEAVWEIVMVHNRNTYSSTRTMGWDMGGLYIPIFGC